MIMVNLIINFNNGREDDNDNTLNCSRSKFISLNLKIRVRKKI